MILKDSHGSWTFVTLLLFQWHDENLRDTIASLLARGAINAGRREEGRGGIPCFRVLDDFNMRRCLETFSGYH